MSKNTVVWTGALRYCQNGGVFEVVEISLFLVIPPLWCSMRSSAPPFCIRQIPLNSKTQDPLVNPVYCYFRYISSTHPSQTTKSYSLRVMANDASIPVPMQAVSLHICYSLSTYRFKTYALAQRCDIIIICRRRCASLITVRHSIPCYMLPRLVQTVNQMNFFISQGTHHEVENGL